MSQMEKQRGEGSPQGPEHIDPLRGSDGAPVCRSPGTARWNSKEEKAAPIVLSIPEGQGSGALHGGVQASAASHKLREAGQPAVALPIGFCLRAQGITRQDRAAADEGQNAALWLGWINEVLNEMGAVTLR